MSSDPYAIQPYFRVAGAAVGFFDFVTSISSEMRYYKRQAARSSISPILPCFIAARYFAILYLVFICATYFSRDIPHDTCAIILWIAPVLRVLAAAGARGVMAFRTVAICHGSRLIFWIVMCLTMVCLAIDSFSISVESIVQDPVLRNCYGGTPKSQLSMKWIFYLSNVIFDLVCISFATAYLWRNSSGHIQPMVKALIADGLVYFLILAGMNSANILLLASHNRDHQAVLQTPTVAALMMLSQRMIFVLQEKTTLIGGTSIISSQRFGGKFGRHPNNTVGLESIKVRTEVFTHTDQADAMPLEDIEKAPVDHHGPNRLTFSVPLSPNEKDDEKSSDSKA